MTPIIFAWSVTLHDEDGVVIPAMVPIRRFHNMASAQFTVNENYRLEAIDEASMRSRRHYFASLYDCWMNLPEDMGERFPTSKHLRKYALIKCGYRDERTLVAASKSEAQRLAAFVKPMDGYAIVVVRDATVAVYTAQSQSVKAMGKTAFQKSKQDVLDLVATMIKVEPHQLGTAA